jgi:hypothetical protein
MTNHLWPSKWLVWPTHRKAPSATRSSASPNSYRQAAQAARSPAPASAAPAPSEKWEVIFHDEFLSEFRAFDPDVRRELATAAKAIELAGPKTGRPHVDTLNGSKHDNMKELRF